MSPLVHDLGFFVNAFQMCRSWIRQKGALIMCMFCKCDTVKESTTTHVVNYNGCVIVIKNVPCEECEQCGEKFYTDEVAEQLEKMVDSAKKLMQEISVIDYSKVA